VMIVRWQHLRYGTLEEVPRARVLRILEEAVGERLVGDLRDVAQHTCPQPHDRFDDDERRRFAAGEDEVPDRQLTVTEMVGDTLIDTFVAPADQREPLA